MFFSGVIQKERFLRHVRQISQWISNIVAQVKLKKGQTEEICRHKK